MYRKWTTERPSRGRMRWLAAVAPIQPLAWELSFAAGAALKRKYKYVDGCY